MRFFIPDVEDSDAPYVLEYTRELLAERGFDTNDRRIYRLGYVHDAQVHIAGVGERHPETGQAVRVILVTPILPP